MLRKYSKVTVITSCKRRLCVEPLSLRGPMEAPSVSLASHSLHAKRRFTPAFFSAAYASFTFVFSPTPPGSIVAGLVGRCFPRPKRCPRVTPRDTVGGVAVVDETTVDTRSAYPTMFPRVVSAGRRALHAGVYNPQFAGFCSGLLLFCSSSCVPYFRVSPAS